MGRWTKSANIQDDVASLLFRLICSYDVPVYGGRSWEEALEAEGVGAADARALIQIGLDLLEQNELIRHVPCLTPDGAFITLYEPASILARLAGV